MNPEDDKRDKILRFLYERHKGARGMSGVAIGIRDLQTEMRNRYGMTQSEVASNLDYLTQVGWVKEVAKERSFTTKGGMRVGKEQVKYKISDVGIDHLEAGSVFKERPASAYVNITNIQGVTVLGDGNIVNVELTDLSRALNDLERAIRESGQMSGEQKLEAASDIATVRAQIAKKHPNRDVIRIAWQALQVLAVFDGVAGALERVGALIGAFLL
ncbi:MAG: hypothetical protein QHJ34_16020 [bacterium]|jgi:hypothetical protein|nr:hypothetical protein [bacterium]